MTRHGYLTKSSKFSKNLNFFQSHEINQFCSSHSLREIYISKFDLLDDHLKEALQKGCEKFAPGIESKSIENFKILIDI